MVMVVVKSSESLTESTTTTTTPTTEKSELNSPAPSSSLDSRDETASELFLRIKSDQSQKQVVNQTNTLRRLSKLLISKTDTTGKEHQCRAHRMTIRQLEKEFETSIQNGLSHEEAKRRLVQNGLNRFTPQQGQPWFLLYLKELTTGFSLLLWFTGLVSCISYAIEKKPEDLYLGIVLIVVVILTGTFSYYQQSSSNKVFQSFMKMAPQQALVLRDGKKEFILAEELVVGDIVFCHAGDSIPADIRVTKSDGMKVDNSSITGESEPLLRDTRISDDPNYLEAKNLAFFSTNCIEGNGIGLVIATGDRTVMGDLACTVASIKPKPTPIAKELDQFVRNLTIIALTNGLVCFLVIYAFGGGFFKAFLFMVGIIIGNVPEGLLPALTVCLTLAAKRMAKKRCLVKNLEAVETLGATSVICTDKTGTLTQNRMTVEHVWCGGNEPYQFRNGRLQPEFERQEKPGIQALIRCAMLCSMAEFLDNNEIIEKRKTAGDASETAIMKFLEQAIGSVQKFREEHPKVAEKPFSSVDKMQYSVHRNLDGKPARWLMVMKGAPERIITRCQYWISADGETNIIDNEFVAKFEEAYTEFGSQGERVLAFCDQDLDDLAYPESYTFDSATLQYQVPLTSLRFLGLISMIDPPRPDVPGAVKRCRRAGITVVMVTGDHPITAQAIAKMCGIFAPHHHHQRATSIISLRSTQSHDDDDVCSRSMVVPGNELDEMPEETLKEILKTFPELVFARTSPKQKLRIVKAFQKLGKVVAVTGDGVNDSLALKKADIGISMGITGSEVSKQAAHMILLDDNFVTCVSGVEEGRRIFDNLKKTISYILSGNICTIYPFLVYLIFGFPVAISPIFALLIALGSDMVPAISLSYEKPERDIMRLRPRNPKRDQMVNWQLLCRAYLQVGMLVCAAAYLPYLAVMHLNGFEIGMLFHSHSRWYNSSDPFPRVSYLNGDTIIYQDTTLEERYEVEKQAQSAFFSGIIIMQCMDVIVSKTRRISIFRHGMHNRVLNYSLVFEAILAIVVLYVPKVNEILDTRPVHWRCFIWAFPFTLIMLAYEEFRKWIIRTYPDSFFGHELLA